MQLLVFCKLILVQQKKITINFFLPNKIRKAIEDIETASTESENEREDAENQSPIIPTNQFKESNPNDFIHPTYKIQFPLLESLKNILFNDVVLEIHKIFDSQNVTTADAKIEVNLLQISVAVAICSSYAFSKRFPQISVVSNFFIVNKNNQKKKNGLKILLRITYWISYLEKY